MTEHTFDTTVEQTGRTATSFEVPLNLRELFGSTHPPIKVTIQEDSDPRKIEAPPDLAAALDDDEEARDFWDRLSYSHRREYVDWVEEAKRDETRKKRVVKAIEALRGGQPKS